ncbi:hypothetical protein ONZ45_g2638 [Pleurotus djamor]|nr:hypothetical protein ONZ45_g2638 [Pleurotus djamor]
MKFSLTTALTTLAVALLSNGQSISCDGAFGPIVEAGLGTPFAFPMICDAAAGGIPQVEVSFPLFNVTVTIGAAACGSGVACSVTCNDDEPFNVCVAGLPPL